MFQWLYYAGICQASTALLSSPELLGRCQRIYILACSSFAAYAKSDVFCVGCLLRCCRKVHHHYNLAQLNWRKQKASVGTWYVVQFHTQIDYYLLLALGLKYGLVEPSTLLLLQFSWHISRNHSAKLGCRHCCNEFTTSCILCNWINFCYNPCWCYCNSRRRSCTSSRCCRC